MSEAQHVCPPPELPACPPEPPKEKCVPPPKPQLLIMAPPFYADLGKNARDVFGKGYHFGLLKLDVKTKTSTGVEFSTGGVSNQESGKVFGSLETKYKFKDLGLTFTEKWNTDNVLTTELAYSDFIEGAKVSLDTAFVPHSGERSGRLKSEWKSDFVALNAELEHKRGFIVKSGAVMNYSGWLCGAQATVDPSQGKLSNLGFSLGCIGKEFILNTSVNDARLFSGSVYHKVSSKLETAVALSWASDNNDTELGIGCKYNLDDDSALRLKVNNQSLIGVGYSQRLREGVTLSLSAQLDGKNFNEGGHKIGVCLELEA